MWKASPLAGKLGEDRGEAFDEGEVEVVEVGDASAMLEDMDVARLQLCR